MLENLTPPKRNYSCKVQTIASDLEEKDRSIFLDAVDSPEWNFKTLSNALADKGLTIVDTAIAKHRRRQCACFR